MVVLNRIVAVLGLALVAVAMAPTMSAGEGIAGACGPEGLINPGYQECWGAMDECGDGSGTTLGVGHYYTWVDGGLPGFAGQSGGWCYAYVGVNHDGKLACVGTETESHLADLCVGIAT